VTQYCQSCGTYGEGTYCTQCGAYYPVPQAGYTQQQQYAQYPQYPQYQQPYAAPYPPAGYGYPQQPYGGYYPAPYPYPQQDEGTVALVLGIVALLALVVFGGVGAIIIGAIAMWLGRKYEAEGRRHGRTAFFLGLVAMIIGIIELMVMLMLIISLTSMGVAM